MERDVYVLISIGGVECGVYSTVSCMSRAVGVSSVSLRELMRCEGVVTVNGYNIYRGKYHRQRREFSGERGVGGRFSKKIPQNGINKPQISSDKPQNVVNSGIILGVSDAVERGGLLKKSVGVELIDLGDFYPGTIRGSSVEVCMKEHVVKHKCRVGGNESEMIVECDLCGHRFVYNS